MPYQSPFALPASIKPELQRIVGYWRDLRRGENNIPFADDVNLSVLRGADTFLLKVFASPLRFRFESSSDGPDSTNATIAGRFLDEISAGSSLSYLLAQSCATIEAGRPTFCHFAASGSDRGFSRILLPAWADGHIDLLLGAIAAD